MKSNFYAVIMAGGIGSRFWPVSTGKFPKQFHDMLGTGQTLLQKTFSRINSLIPSENTFILTNEHYLDLVLEQLPEITESQTVLEPAMRNTAPCILLSALKIYKQDPAALMLVAPSDHWIENEDLFLQDIKTCFQACEQKDILLTLGIKPTFPNTGYGYVESDESDINAIKKVRQFREKPDYETARKFLEAGNYFWNAGIFIWSVKSIIASFKKNMPEMYALFSEGINVLNTTDEITFISENYEKAENISIDFGILERADNVFVKKATFDWNDLGTWGALHDKLEKDVNDNSVVRAIPYLKNAKGNIIHTATGKLVIIDGLKDYIVVDKDDVLMIYPKEKEQHIKSLLTEVKKTFGKKFT